MRTGGGEAVVWKFSDVKRRAMRWARACGRDMGLRKCGGWDMEEAGAYSQACAVLIRELKEHHLVCAVASSRANLQDKALWKFSWP